MEFKFFESLRDWNAIFPMCSFLMVKVSVFVDRQISILGKKLKFVINPYCELEEEIWVDFWTSMFIFHTLETKITFCWYNVLFKTLLNLCLSEKSFVTIIIESYAIPRKWVLILQNFNPKLLTTSDVMAVDNNYLHIC